MQLEGPSPYTSYKNMLHAHNRFNKVFLNNPFGCKCSVCARLWFKNDLKKLVARYEELLTTIAPNIYLRNGQLCSTCDTSLRKNKVPTLATYNGFTYPTIPVGLPKLDLVSERLVSPRLPFMQIRRLSHVHGQYGIYGQVINVPVSVDNMVNCLPRQLDDDYCINVHIKKKQIHKRLTYKDLSIRELSILG